MRSSVRVIIALARRDALTAASYRLNAGLSLLAGFFGLWMLFYLAKIFGGAQALEAFKADYFRFAVVGTALASVTRAGLGGVSGRVREAQLDGSLGYLLSTPASAPQVLAGLSVYPLAMALAGALVYVASAALLFGANFSGAAILPALVATVAGVVASLGLGMVSAATVLVLRRGDPSGWLLGSASYLLSGVLYPVSVLPQPLQTAAKCLPATHAIEAVRKTLLAGGSWAEIAPELSALLIITAITLPLGAVAARIALARVEQDGSAGQG